MDSYYNTPHPLSVPILDLCAGPYSCGRWCDEPIKHDRSVARAVSAASVTEYALDFEIRLNEKTNHPRQA